MRFAIIGEWKQPDVSIIVECLKQNGFSIVRQYATDIVGEYDGTEYIPKELMGHDAEKSLEAKILKALGKKPKKYDNKPSIGWGWETYPCVKNAFGPDGIPL